MTPVTFPLLKLPLLTIKHVFLVMTMEQIYDFSYCSKKAQRILKACNGKNVEICVKFSGDCQIHFHRKNQLSETFSLCLRNIIPGCSWSRNFLHSTNDRSIQLKFSTSPLTAAISRLDHLFNSFDTEIRGFYIDGDCVQRDFRPLVQSICLRKNVFTDVGIFGSIERGDLKYFIENCTTRGTFRAVFEIERPYNLNLNAKMIILKNSAWLTVSNLMTTNFETGLVTEPQWNLNDWITLLNAWKNGWNPKMSHLITKSDHFDFQYLSDNLPFGIIREETVVRICQHEMRTPNTHLIEGGVDIRSNDGKLATIFGSGEFSSVIEVHVWDEQSSDAFSENPENPE
ncbi:unnamed protein product [Caenorhabditis brenneri]